MVNLGLLPWLRPITKKKKLFGGYEISKVQILQDLTCESSFHVESQVYTLYICQSEIDLAKKISRSSNQWSNQSHGTKKDLQDETLGQTLIEKARINIWILDIILIWNTPRPNKPVVVSSQHLFSHAPTMSSISRWLSTSPPRSLSNSKLAPSPTSLSPVRRLFALRGFTEENQTWTNGRVFKAKIQTLVSK